MAMRRWKMLPQGWLWDGEDMPSSQNRPPKRIVRPAHDQDAAKTRSRTAQDGLGTTIGPAAVVTHIPSAESTEPQACDYCGRTGCDGDCQERCDAVADEQLYGKD
jgi:hypothetical protein